MWLSARVEYAVRASLELAENYGHPITSEALASAQAIPASFLENIVGDLRRAGLILTRRGRGGGLVLARPPHEITIADVIRAETGNLADIHGIRPEDAAYPGAAQHLTEVWVAARTAYRRVLEGVTLADALAGNYGPEIRELVTDPESWESHRRSSN